ncbi:MAG: DUF1995 family protein [Leptolyngbya sp.]|nr:DUF1995 family protein [Leptolyngbya sp.]
MTESGVPRSLEAAIAQAQAATRAAIEAGVPRILVEFSIPELKIMPVAQQFYPLFEEMGLQFKLYFPDAGAAALAKRDWGNPDFSIRGINEAKGRLEADDDAFLIIEPSSVEVNEVEEFCNAAVGKFVVMLNPKLEDIATIGIGYAGRQLRERFLSTLESCYYLQPLEGATILRAYPGPWQVWGETAEDDYELMGEFSQKPSGETLAKLFSAETEAGEADTNAPTKARPKKAGFLSELQSFLRALSQ